MNRTIRILSPEGLTSNYVVGMVADMTPNTPDDWLVTVPPYDDEGVKIERFVITEQDATASKIRALFNPQRSDRSLDAGTYTKLTVDGILWMSDTPAEIRDMYEVDGAMSLIPFGSMLIVGMGIGAVVHRAMQRNIATIDVVERDERIVLRRRSALRGDGQGAWRHAADPHHRHPPVAGTPRVVLGHRVLRHLADDHRRRHAGGDAAPQALPQPSRLVNAWAQDERIAENKRIRTGTGFY